MSDQTRISKYVNLLIQFGQKLQTQINKKYRPFIRQLLMQNIKQRVSNMNPQKIALSQQMIAFKLGIESKSTKCIELSLNYLYKLFDQGFVNLTAPNYCEDFVITQSSIQKKKKQVYETEVKSQIRRWLQPLIHFKNTQISTLVLKNYQYIIIQPILPSLIQISEQLPSELCFTTICSYFNIRFYLFQQVYLYTKAEISLFKHIPVNEKLNAQVNSALDREENYENLIQKYLREVVYRVSAEGGKYGLCVICDQNADFFCRVTKASLCGLDCKKKHLEVADNQLKNYYQSNVLSKSIFQSMNIISKYLTEKQSPFIFSVMQSIIERPYLFQLVNQQFRSLIRNNIPGILYKASQSKNQQIIQRLYFMISSLAKWWPSQCLPQIQFFIKENILKVLRDKKPNFKSLILVFKALDKIFQNGRSIVQLYINLDCQVNQTDVIGHTLFQLSKIAQDKFTNTNIYSKQQKIIIKNSCMTLFMTFSKSLNDFRRNYQNTINVKQIHSQKTRKQNLQKFTQKFNQHWSEGLKSLFNLNLVGLDSNHQIVNIIMSLSGLNKKMIDSMMFQKTCKQYLQIFMSRLKEQDEPLVFKLLSFYKYIPMTQNASIGILKFVDQFKNIFGPDLLQDVRKLTNILMKSQSLEDFKTKIKQHLPQQADYRYLYLRMLTARKLQTAGKRKQIYTLCLSHSYLQSLSSQVSLLQIPISYMLQTNYDADKIVNLTKQLVSISIHSNWVSLLIKHSGIDMASERTLTQYNIKIIKGVLQISMLQADFIMDWVTVLNFVYSIHFIQTQNHPVSKKYLLQNKTILLQQLSSLMIQNCLVNMSIKSINNFSRFIISVLLIAKQHLILDQIVMLQKFFHMLDANIQKYLINFNSIFSQFRKFVEQLKVKTTSETYIYITDMLKQLLLKVLKSPQVKDQIILAHLQVFNLILQKNKQSKQVGDFVMNSISTIIVYNYNLKSKSWKEAIKIIRDQSVDFSYQTGVIVRKILNEHMRNIEDQGQTILEICFKLIKVDDYKSSVEAIHNIKLCLDIQREFLEKQYLRMKQTKQQQLEQNKGQVQNYLSEDSMFINLNKEVIKLKKLLLFSIDNLINYIGQSFSDAISETLFVLFSSKVNFSTELNLQQKQISGFIQKIFSKLQQIQKQNPELAQGIMNKTLFWSDNNGYHKIVKNLQGMILNKYTRLSVAALKCIKAYIQMAKLKQQKQWQSVQQTLLKIIQNTQIQRFFNLENQMNVQQIVQQLISNKLAQRLQQPLNVDLNVFIHQSQQQMKCVQLLPNHGKCLDILIRIYDEKVKFNDMVLIRTIIWKKGLGRQFPPDLLTLEQTISNRIMSIYLRQQNSQNILKFTYRILQKYLQSTKTLEYLQQHYQKVSANCNNQNNQLYSIMVNYWNKRRQPLIKLISYMMPKLINQCKEKADRKTLLLYFVKIMPIVENKDSVLKTIKDLTQKQL